MTVTIIIKDNNRGDANVKIHFDPPAERNNPGTAQKIGMFLLEKLREEADSMKTTQVVTKD